MYAPGGRDRTENRVNLSLLAGTSGSGNFTKIAQRLPVRITIDADQDRTALRPGMAVVVDAD